MHDPLIQKNQASAAPSQIKKPMKIFKHLRSEWFRYGFETLAVVVGILAAFALENWNDERKEGKAAQGYEQALVADLVLDTIQLNQSLGLLVSDTTQLWDFIRRMSDDKVKLETLIQIARFEFNPWMYAGVTFNTSTYRSLGSTGNLGMLDQWLQKSLLELNELQQEYSASMNLDVRSYLDQLNFYTQKYPFNDQGHIDPDSKLSDVIWEGAQFRQLGIDLNSIVAYKLVIDQSSIDLLLELQEKNRAILEELDK